MQVYSSCIMRCIGNLKNRSFNGAAPGSLQIYLPAADIRPGEEDVGCVCPIVGAAHHHGPPPFCDKAGHAGPV